MQLWAATYGKNQPLCIISSGICWYLTLAEIVTLMLVCGRFWHGRIRSGVFSSSWQLMQLPQGGPDLTYARFHILRLLEYDGLLAEGLPIKYCCWGCMKTHERQAFPLDEYQKKVDLKFNPNGRSKSTYYYKPGPTFRYCSLAKRRIWFGIYGEMTFAELKYTLSIPHAITDKHCPSIIRIPDRSCFWKCARFNRRLMYFYYVFSLAKVDDVPSSCAVVQMCKYVNIPLCPHLRLGNNQVIDLSERPNQREICVKCSREFSFGINQGFINIRVRRHVGTLLSPTDPIWQTQSYASKSDHLKSHCRAFSRWFKTTYLSDAGKGKAEKENKNGGFEEFKDVMPASESSGRTFTDVCSRKPKQLLKK